MNYQQHYDRLIARARSRVLTGYRERHHVIPRCLGGNDTSANIVALTPEEHYVAHQILVRLFPASDALVFAAVRMAKKASGSRAYGWLRRRVIDALRRRRMSDSQRAAISAAQSGKPKSAEQRAKIAAALQGNRHCAGRVRSAEERARVSAKLSGRKKSFRTHRPHSEETKAKMSAAKRGKKLGPYPANRVAKMTAGVLAYYAAKRTA